MKNCELNVRTIDEGSIDEKSGMNFSEYIAILSGNTSLLEKSILEKKIAVLESLRVAHLKEINRSKHRIEDLFQEKDKIVELLKKLHIDQEVYRSHLQHGKDGTKLNPLQLTDCLSNDAEAMGKYLINLYQQIKPQESTIQQKKIGILYGFDCCIQCTRNAHIEKNEWVYEYQNQFYIQSPHSDLRYSYNEGRPNIDNPKLAARIFLNAIDRVNNIIEQKEHALQEMNKNISMMQQIINKPFDSEEQLRGMKKELSQIERDITIKIQERKMEKSNDDPANRKEEVSLSEEPIPIEKILRKIMPNARLVTVSDTGRTGGIKR